MRIGTLESLLATYRARYRHVAVPPELERLELAIGRRRHRVETLQEQVAALHDEIDRLDAEILGCRKGYEALLADTIERIRRTENEGWSPAAVVGYRLWGWREGGLYGAWERWMTATKTATCRAGNDEVPHSDRRCGRLGCGIYATKDLESLLEEHTTAASDGYLAGMVELTGKVVEHEHGYRAQRATVVAAALIGRDRVLTTRDPAIIEDLFALPQHALERHGRSKTRTAWEEILDLLTTEGSRRWTSATRSA
jgi:hypothetical protein